MTPLGVVGLVLVVGVAWVLRADPWKVSMGRGIAEFSPQYVAAPPAGKFKDFPRDKDNKLRNGEVKWRGQLLGPESLVFDSQGRGPYTGVSDGRILRYDGPELGWTTFAYTSTNRSAICAPKSPLAPNYPFEHVCGRPLGLRFNKAIGELWIADAYLGILKVGPEGGQAESVLNAIDGKRMKFTNDLDFDDKGNLYFTDSSTHWQRRQFIHCLMEADDTGRLIKYNPKTKETTVLIDHLRFSNGVAVSKDGTFLIVVEGRMGRLYRYWLKGEKAGTKELFAELPGYPDNIRRNEAGDFWVACHCPRTPLEAFLGTQPLLRKLIIRLPVPTPYVYKMLAGKPHGMILKYSPSGEFKEALEDEGGLVASKISEVEEHDGKLYLGSVLLPQIVVYTLLKP
jgi:sugar lactone lactonase YvrE